MKTATRNRIGMVLLLLLASTSMAFSQGLFKIIEGLSDQSLKATMETNVNAMMMAMNTAANQNAKTVKLNKDNFTSEAIKDIEQMWKSSAIFCPPVNIMSRCLKTSYGYQVRGIPVDLKEADEKEKRQELAIDFLPNGKISNVSIAIEMHRYDQIMAEKESDIDYARRQIIVDFVENFRTAYNRKDLDYLNMVYSNDALIITGREIKKKDKDYGNAMLSSLGAQKFEYQVQSKAEYMEKLKRIFKKNKYINIKFEEVTVARHPKRNKIYGVTLKQYWNTSTYSDVGYLFLMINFENGLNPTIEVRTWQPNEYQGREIARNEVFSFKNFDL